VVDVRTVADGSVVITPRGVPDSERGGELRRVLVHTVRRVRPFRLIVDLAEVPEIDPLDAGSVAAACELGDDHHVTVFVDNPRRDVATRLAAAGVPRQRLRGATA
jgi:anti-anti-sigma regulatory factor